MDRYVVFGNPIGHSKSPLIHRLFAEQTAQKLDYSTLLAPLDDFSDLRPDVFPRRSRGECDGAVQGRGLSSGEQSDGAGAAGRCGEHPEQTR